MIGVILAFVLSSCGTTATGTPTLTVDESIRIIVETAMAATQTAKGSVTPSPTWTSTKTPSPTLSATPTLTPVPPTQTPRIVIPTYRCQDSQFVKDMSIPDGTVLSPGEVFVKTWKFQNTGTCSWSSRYSIIYLRGDRMRGSDAMIDREIAVDRRLEVSVTMVAPSQPGRYRGYWQLADRFGYPFGDVVTVDILVAYPTPTFTPTTIVNRGSLQILKTVGNPDGAALPANYMVYFNCGAGYIGQVSVAPGGSAVVAGIPVGSTCSVTEAAPNPIAGYTWGTITYTPASILISAKDQTYTITVGNSITRDRGSLQILKIVNNPDGAPVPASFTANYNCGPGYSGLVSFAPGSPATIAGIPTGSMCTVTEAAPDPIPGYSWGTVIYTPASVLINARDQTFSINVDNSITRDRGILQIIKDLGNPDGAPVPASFNVNYDCGSGYSGTTGIATGSPVTIPNIPYGRTCTVTEAAPDPIAGYVWDNVTYTPASVVISARDQVFTITIGNAISLVPGLQPIPPDED